MSLPVFINSRDRVTPLRQLVEWLERAGVQEIYIIDNDSVYEPVLDYYRQSPHRVIKLGRNAGKNALWDAPEVFELTRDRPFAYSDSDIVPDPECPLDALDVFLDILHRYRDGPRGIHKAGFGICYHDIPDHYRHKAQAVAVERELWAWPLERNVFYASIDTQFAVYRAGSQARPHYGARTGPPYVARHHSYYLDLDRLGEEDAFYARRSEEARSSKTFTHWASDQIRGPQAQPRAPLPSVVTRLRWRLRRARSFRARPNQASSG